MGKGKDGDAVRIVHEAERRNGKTPALIVDDLRPCINPTASQAQATGTQLAINEVRGFERRRLSHA